MGRELRRKETRKNKTKLTEPELDTSIKASTLFKILIFGIIILLVLYYVIAVFVTKEINVSGNKNNQNETANTGVSNKILATNIFNQKEDTYYVYFYDFNNEDENISSAINNKSNLSIYRVDTSSALNQKYITEESGNRNVTSVSDLSVKNPTIISVANDTVTAYYEGVSEILDFLNS